MQPDSIKRLAVTVLGGLVIFFGNKLGLSHETEGWITSLLCIFLAQSGVNAVFAKLAANRGVGAFMNEITQLQRAFQEANARQAMDAGRAAAQAPSGPGAGSQA